MRLRSEMSRVEPATASTVPSAAMTRAENVFVMSSYSSWTGVGRFIGQPFSAAKHLLNLALKFRG